MRTAIYYIAITKEESIMVLKHSTYRKQLLKSVNAVHVHCDVESLCVFFPISNYFLKSFSFCISENEAFNNCKMKITDKNLE